MKNKSNAYEKGNQQDHKPFQFGTNPMEMTAFEKGEVAKETALRSKADRKYIMGIQGRDGGIFEDQQWTCRWPDKHL